MSSLFLGKQTNKNKLISKTSYPSTFSQNKIDAAGKFCVTNITKPPDSSCSSFHTLMYHNNHHKTLTNKMM